MKPETPPNKPAKTFSLKDIKVVKIQYDGKGGKKEKELTKDEIMALVPEKPKEELLRELKKKSLALEKKIKETENAER
jgi:hypothetical protein